MIGRLRQIERANDFLEAFKNSPDFDNIAVEVGKGDAPASWRSTNLWFGSRCSSHG
jgi:hypothetical protein